METQQFWQLIEDARQRAAEPADAEAVAEAARALLAERSPEQIVAAERALDTLLAQSYLNPLWAAAYTINGGCSDDGFDYFRGWLIMQGRAVFEAALADPDSLAELPAVRAAAGEWEDLSCETTLSIALAAHREVTGEELPLDPGGLRYPELDPAWDFDFDDREEMARRLPRLAALYLD
ncbi:DUF4240 domain-containing protein [Kitasatospora sp. LaBMicrA B282]|uniref:DUF4240 domain-containing protein n=1 Tax=Kitasatospora sp. LaBMicrA B282 TaxID=3420949 RepID=UPI003D112747